MNNILKNHEKLNFIIFSTSGLPKVLVSSNRVSGLIKSLINKGNNVYFLTCKYKYPPYNQEYSFKDCKELIILKPSKILSFIFLLINNIYKKYSMFKKLMKKRADKKENYEKLTKKKNIIDTIVRHFAYLEYYNGRIGFICPNKAIKDIQNIINNINSWPIILITSHGPPICHEVGIKIKRKYKKKVFWVADYRDPMEYNDFVNITTSFKLSGINYRTFLNADLITIVSKGLAVKLLEQAMEKKVNIKNKIYVLYNGIMEIRERQSKFPKEKIKVVYTGSLYKNEMDFNLLLKAVSKFGEFFTNNLELIYAGKNEDILLDNLDTYKEVKSIVKSYGLITKERVTELQKNASILLLIKTNKDYDKGILTGKFYEYLSYRKPILVIGNRDNEFNHIANNIGGIKIFGYDEIDKISHFLKKCIEVYPKLEKLFGTTNSEEVKKFTWDNLCEGLLSEINTMLNKRR